MIRRKRPAPEPPAEPYVNRLLPPGVYCETCGSRRTDNGSGGNLGVTAAKVRPCPMGCEEEAS